MQSKVIASKPPQKFIPFHSIIGSEIRISASKSVLDAYEPVQVQLNVLEK